MPSRSPPAPAPGRPAQEQLDERRDERRDGVDDELGRLAVHERDEDDQPADDDEVPGDRGERRDRELVVGVQDPDDDPRDRQEPDDREHDPGQRHGEVGVAARVAEGEDQERRDEDQHGRQERDADQDEPEDRRGDAPGPRLLLLGEQLAEDGHERARERGVAHERPDEARDLRGDREGVDLPGDAEEVGGDDLADEAEGAGKAGREREGRRRARKPTRLAALAHPGEYTRMHQRHRAPAAPESDARRA
jgi:hypothetical protein